jgi:3-phenylpropionate/cinnamic acid dioxygenase small subunit
MNEEKIKEILEENAKLKEDLQATKEHLKKYTAPPSSKVYYEKHKELVKERVKKCREKTTYTSTPEQRKEYNKQAYLRRKVKSQKDLEEKQNTENI